MAWAEKLPDGNYRACWRDAGGARRSTVFEPGTRRRLARKEQALKVAIGREAIARDNGPQNTGRGLTWGEWSERWFELRRVEAETLRNDIARARDHVKPYWGKKRLKAITRDQVQAWVNELADGDLVASTVIKVFRVFSRSMKDAVRAGHLTATPCTLITLPEPGKANEHYLTKAEFWTLHAHLEQPWADAAVLLAYLGLRFGELAGLHWARVDLERGTVTVAETWNRRTGIMKGYPKSKKPRVLPLPGEAVEVLMRHPSEAKSCGKPHANGTCTSDLVLRAARGEPLTPETMQHALDRVTEELGMAHVRNHDLRHSFASWLGQDGVPLSVIQQLLGHGQITTTQRYAHFGSEQYERVLAALR